MAFTVIASATMPSTPSPSITAATATWIRFVAAEPAPLRPIPTRPTETEADSARTYALIVFVDEASTNREPPASMLVRVVVALTSAGEQVRFSCFHSAVFR